MIFESFATFVQKVMFFSAYVNTTSSFPKPLSAQEELDYLTKFKKGDMHAKDVLIHHNLRLVAHIVKKYSGTEEADDLISSGSLGLIKAINTYQLGHGTQFSTYAARCIENEILMLMRANKKHMVVDSLDEPVGMDKDGSDIALLETIPDENDKLLNDANNSFLMEQINQVMKENLNEREYYVIMNRYGLNNKPAYTQREVADMLNISRSYISRIEKKALQILKEKIEEKKIYYPEET